MRKFLDKMKPKLTRHGMVRGATSINFPDDSLKRDVHERSYYGMNYRKLRRRKTTWDKDNFSSWPQGIQVLGIVASPQQQAVKDDDQNLMKDIPAENFIAKEPDMTDVLANQQWESYRPISTDGYGNETLLELVY